MLHGGALVFCSEMTNHVRQGGALDNILWGVFRQPDEENDYEWVREYNYQIQQEEGDERKTYVFRFEQGQVSYAHIHAKLTLSKRGKHTKGELDAQDFPRPSKVLPMP